MGQHARELAAWALALATLWIWAVRVSAEEVTWRASIPEASQTHALDPTGDYTFTGATLTEEELPADFVKRVEDFMKKAGEKEAADKKKAASRPTVVVQGRVHADAVFFNQNADSRTFLGDAQDAAYFRTARIGVGGDMFEVFNYRLEIDAAARNNYTTSSAGTPAHTHTISDVSVISFKDAYVGVNELPLLGNVQIGHYKEPFSLEELTSSRFISFMERSLPNAFSPARNMGIRAMNTFAEESGTWAIGVFRDLTDIPPFRADDDGGRAVTGRVTWLPWYDEATEGRGLFHVGFGYSYRDDDDGVVRFRSRPEVGMMRDQNGLDRTVVDTGNIANTVNYHLFGPEAALVYGPFSLQTEWIGVTVNRSGADPDAYFSGYYVYASYFLTGENRVYNRRAGCFDRVKPFENFFRVRTGDGDVQMGKGAWEILYRYSNLDLQDFTAGINGGTADDHTLGLTWYWNPYAKVMFNYIHTTAARPSAGWTVPMDIFAMRMALEY